MYAAGSAPVLRVCADPGNLPFSNQQQEGFENRIAGWLARDLGVELENVWVAERDNYIRNMLNAGRCDAVLGVPAGIDDAATTTPYYSSTYVLVGRRDEPAISSLFDERLAGLRIGIHVTGDDFAPPGRALASRGLSANLVGYSLLGAYEERNPPARIITAVANKDVDVAVVWGPFAGYFAPRQSVPLRVSAVQPAQFMGAPFVYAMAIAVRRGDDQLLGKLNAALKRECGSIRALLREYGVPEAGSPEGGVCESSPEPPSPSSH